MKKIIIFLLVPAIVTLSFLSCEKKETKNSNPPPLKIEQAKTDLAQFNDSINKVWKIMMQSDDQKIADIKRLLLEISYTDKPSMIELTKIQKMQEQILSKRYDQQTMVDSKKIDDYDFATDSLVKSTMSLTSSTLGIENHPLAKELTEDIMEADNNVVRYRTLYDSWTKLYNAYLENHEKQLKELGEPFASYEKKPLFQKK